MPPGLPSWVPSPQCLWQARDLGTSSGACMRDARAGRNRFRVFLSFYCKTTIGQGIYCNRVCIWKFLVRYIVTGCIFCAPSGLRQGPVLTPPPQGVHSILSHFNQIRPTWKFAAYFVCVKFEFVFVQPICDDACSFKFVHCGQCSSMLFDDFF